jgi:hypothetical protein
MAGMTVSFHLQIIRINPLEIIEIQAKVINAFPIPRAAISVILSPFMETVVF